MKKRAKRILAAVLCAVMVLTAVPLSTAVQESEINSDSSSAFSSQSGLNLIANNLMSGEDSGDYSIVYLDIEDKTATVELNNKEACTLVVAIYEEGSMHMFASGVKEIEANAGTAEVEIDIDTMPETYVAKAFLLDGGQYALCKEYVSYKHTNAYLEFLDKEPKDFSGKEVVVFDDSKEQTDFGVFDDAVIIEDSAEEMTFSFDEATNTYTFENAGDDLKNLSVGDVYYYQYGEKSNEFLLFKVESVSSSGSTVTVVQDEDIALSEAFSFIRVDNYGDYSDISANDFTYGSALTPIGSAAKARNIVYEENETNEWGTSISLDYTAAEGLGGAAEATVSATLGYKLKVHVELYYDPELFGEDFYEFKSEITNTFTIAGLSITGKISLPEDKVNIESPSIPVGPFTLSIGAAPIVSVSASLSGDVNVTKKLTVTADSTNGMDKSATSSTTFEPEFENEFTVKFGAKVSAELALALIIELEPSVSGGVEFTGDLDVVGVLADKHHDCYTCIDCESNVFINGLFTLKVKIIPKVMDFEWPFIDLTKTWHLYDFYISISSQGFKTDLGECPNIRYRALVKVKDEEGKNLEGVTVKCASGVCDSNGDGKFNETSILTDANGEAIFYLKKGAHYFTAEKVKYLKAKTDVSVIQSSKYVPITMKDDKQYNVTLKITDKDGNPLSGATFYSETAYYDVDGDGVNEKTSAVTGSDGIATLQFSEGVHTVSASCNGYETKTQQTIVTEDKTFTIKLDKIEYYNLSIAVKDEEGNAIPGAAVTVTGDADQDGTDETETANTTTSGAASFKLKSTSWDVTVSRDGYLTKSVTVIWLNEDKDLEVVLQEGNEYKLNLKVVDKKGNAISDALVTLSGDSNGDEIDESIQIFSNSSGMAIFKLVPGTWFVTVSKDKFETNTSYVSIIDSDIKKEIVLKKDGFKTGDIIEFGFYPQSEVEDEILLDELNKVNLKWNFYNYYSGNGQDNSMEQVDYMKYADVEYNNEKYRAVTFSAYRPSYSYGGNDSFYSEQDDNGYYVGNIYWFKYEPIKWRVLDPDEGLVFCETIIDTQAYNNTSYYNAENGKWYKDPTYTVDANEYATSSIREWLNDDFYNSAFSDEELKYLYIREIDNGEYTSGGSLVCYDETTYDKVFLLSITEVKNWEYGFKNNDSRCAYPSDYARCQGLLCSYFRAWLLRTAEYSENCSNAFYVRGFDGGTAFSSMVCYTDRGVRPAILLDLDNDFFDSQLPKTFELYFSKTSTNSLDSQAVEAIETSAEGVINFTEKNAVASNDYILLNVKGWGEDFRLKSENLFFIDRVTADENGAVSVSFTPSEYHADSVTLLIGDFGNGIEAKEIKPAVSIKNNPGSATIKYGETLRLTALAENLPAGAYIKWFAEGSGVEIAQNADGSVCEVKSVSSGTATVIARVVDENGNPITDSNGAEISASQKITSKAGFFQKIISFFKNLFGINRTIVQVFKGII